MKSIERGKVDQAAAMDDVSRALAGARLFDMLCDRMAWGVLVDEPDADEARVDEAVRQRIRQLQDQDKRG